MNLNKLFEAVLEDSRFKLTKRGRKATKDQSAHFIPFKEVHEGMSIYIPDDLIKIGKIIRKIESMDDLEKTAEDSSEWYDSYVRWSEEDKQALNDYNFILAKLKNGDEGVFLYSPKALIPFPNEWGRFHCVGCYTFY